MKITKAMFEKLEYDKSPTSEVKATAPQSGGISQPTVMLIFRESDLNSASYHLNQSMQNPYAANAVASVFVQESVIDDFTAKINEKVVPHQLSLNQQENYTKVLERVRQFNAKTICVNDTGPLIVYDFTHEQLGLNTGDIVTLHPFRTTKEAISLCLKQRVIFANASIWSESNARAYEIVEALHCSFYFINCFNKPMDCLSPYIKNKTSFATMENNYHYETLINSNQEQKSVVFPYGTIFAN